MKESGKWLHGIGYSQLMFYPEDHLRGSQYKYVINLSMGATDKPSYMDIFESSDPAAVWLEEVQLQSLFQDYLNPQEAELILFHLDYNCEYPVELIRELSNKGD